MPLDICKDYVVPMVTNFSGKICEFEYYVKKSRYQI